MQTTKRIVSLGTAAMVLASLISPNLHSQESPIPHPPSGNVDWRFENKPPIAGQLVSFLMEDRDDDDDRREKSRDNHRAKKDKKSQKSRKSQPEHREQAHAAPVHSEVLELLRNINRTLKSMETMMREDMEQDRKRPEQAFQHMVPPMPPKFGPQNFNRSFGPGMRMPSPPNNRGPQPQNQDNRGPRNFAPRNDGPRSDGPRSDGPRGDGPQMQGPQVFRPTFGQQFQNRGNDGPRNDGPRNDGPRN